jgi:predicted hotdog family 3-hydroxylacyl-ACP dehydratase
MTVVIRDLIPHGGSMCLISTIEFWNESTIECQAICGNDGHPLRRGRVLPSCVAIEYAAQACALHGALLDKASTPIPGYLAKLSGVELFTGLIEPGEDPLTISAKLISRSSQGCRYTFDVRGTRHELAAGTLMIAFLVPSP